MSYEQLTKVADEIRARTHRDAHDVAVVLGSGLGSYAATLPDAVEIPYEELPEFPIPKVEGHAGSLFSVTVGGGSALVFSGRVHFYEGWPIDRVVFGVRAAIVAGARRVLLTNAAGGVGDGLSPGDLVLLSDHINLTGANPLNGPNDPRLGPRFPDMSEVYSVALREQALEAAAAAGVDVKKGVYAWFTGPSYETPAEIRMARTIGADLVGMSTVPEAIAARHMGADVLGISLVTNLAAGISDMPLSHEEVTETADQAREKFTGLLDALLPRLV